MKINSADKIEQEKIMEFDKECIKYKNFPVRFIAYIFAFILSAMYVIPLSEYTKNDYYMLAYYFCMSLWLVYGIVMPYIIANETSNSKKRADMTWSIIQYMPVSRWNFVYTRLVYLAKFLWKLTAISVIIQIIIAAVMKQFYIKNFLFVIVAAFIIPMICGGIVTLGTTLRRR